MITKPTDDSAQPPVLYGLVMAGGRSARMGQEKFALSFHGRPQVQHCYDLLSRHVERAFVSVREEQAGAPALEGLPQIHDRYPEMGPMSGILSAVETHPQAAWLVLACDLPFVDDAAVEALIAGRDPRRVATALMASDGFFEPLFAIYEPAIAPVLALRKEKSAYSLRDMLNDLDVRLLCAPDDSLLANVNTPEDAEQARARIALVGREGP